MLLTYILLFFALLIFVFSGASLIYAVIYDNIKDRQLEKEIDHKDVIMSTLGILLGIFLILLAVTVIANIQHIQF